MTTNELERLGLTGRTITGLAVGPHESYLVLHTNQGDLTWGTDSDCCSETWFADVVGFDNLVGHPILTASESFENDPEDGRSRQDYDSVGIVSLTTDAGEAEVRWRNSSNGYYGGSIFLVGSDNHGWYHTEKPSAGDVVTEITGDWEAPNA
jgi:hypothetical protein